MCQPAQFPTLLHEAFRDPSRTFPTERKEVEKREREREGKGEQEYPEKRQSVAAVVAAFEIGQTVTIIRYEDAVEAIVISTR